MLVGGCDETLEPNQVFSYMNLGRAFSEIQMGASFFCLHKNKWWQTSRGPMLDAGAFVAGLEYATGVEATVLGKPSPSYFDAALDALDAEPELTWLVTDDVEADVRGARLFGMKTALVRTGKFQPPVAGAGRRDAGHRRVVAGASSRLLEEDLRGGLDAMKVGVDLIEIERVRARAENGPAVPRALLHGGRARVLRLAPRTPRRRATRPASPARRRSGRRSAVACASRGGRSRSWVGRSRP